MHPAGLAEVQRAKADGRWDAAYEPQSRATVPDDLQAALHANRAARRPSPPDEPEPVRDPVPAARREAAETRARRLERFVAMLERGETPHRAVSGLGLVLSLPSVARRWRPPARREQAGFESVWATEFTDRSATVAIAAMAAATERITVGSAIAYAFGRTPLLLAAEARDLDALAVAG
jgi:hypothetical protein